MKTNKTLNTILGIVAAYQIGSTFDTAKANSNFYKTPNGAIGHMQNYNTAVSIDNQGNYTAISDLNSNNKVNLIVFGNEDKIQEIQYLTPQGIERYTLENEKLKGEIDYQHLKNTTSKTTEVTTRRDPLKMSDEINRRRAKYSNTFHGTNIQPKTETNQEILDRIANGNPFGE